MVTFGQVFTEDFESGSAGYTTSSPECVSGSDYFILSNDAALPANFIGNATNFFAAQDYDGCVGSSTPQTLVWSGINISGCSGLSLSIDAAEDDDGPTNQDWDANSIVTVSVSIDGGAYVDIIQFAAVGGTNTEPALDTDFDGTGDGTTLTETWQTFTNAIAGSGTTLDLQITIAGLDAGDEDIAFDNIVITGTGCGGGPSNTITTGVVNGGPFTVDCTTSDAGTVDFTSTGTFNAPNIYTAQLSDASGSFSAATDIGTLTSTANSGTINITIPAGLVAGTGYIIRIVSDDPAVIGSNSASFTINSSVTTGALIMNEMSNGASGVKEYFEMMVIGGACSEVNIQGLIFDDNNGDWGGSGIASGHYRFTTDVQWGCVPTGTLIVVYNDGDPNASLPADDETDANADNVYILPVSSTYIETCTSDPNNGSAPYNVGGCVYSSGGTWTALGMANGGDVAQTRDAAGNFVHGMGYGGMSAPAGGIDFGGSGGGGDAFIFDNAVNDDYTNSSNFSFGAVASTESPGSANSANNAAYIASFDCLVLPVEMLSFEAVANKETAVLTWSTASESNCSHYLIERSKDGKNFQEIGSVQGAGSSTIQNDYKFIDHDPFLGKNYYRLKQVDYNNSFQHTGIRYVRFSIKELHLNSYSYNEGTLFININGELDNIKLSLFDVSGKLISSFPVTAENQSVNVGELKTGVYFLVGENSHGILRSKIIIHSALPNGK